MVRGVSKRTVLAEGRSSVALVKFRVTGPIRRWGCVMVMEVVCALGEAKVISQGPRRCRRYSLREKPPT